MTQNRQVRLSTRAVIINDSEILILKDISDPAQRFVLPGGGIEFTESAKNALKRELLEEVGASLSIGRFLGCFEQGFTHWQLGQLHDVSLLFLVEVSTEQKHQIVSQEERYLCCWFSIDKINEIDLGPNELKELLPFWLKHDFDESFKSAF